MNRELENRGPALTRLLYMAVMVWVMCSASVSAAESPTDEKAIVTTRRGGGFENRFFSGKVNVDGGAGVS